MKSLVLLMMVTGLAVAYEDAWDLWVASIHDKPNGGGNPKPDGGGKPNPLPDKVPPFKPVPYKLKATCDSMLTLYVNGKRKVFSSNWAEISHLELPEEAVIAIKCRKLGKEAGIYTKFTPDLPNDTKWKCSTERQRDWHLDNFQPPKSWVEPAKVQHKSSVSANSDNWFWIPKQSPPKYYSYVFCRLKLPKQLPPRPPQKPVEPQPPNKPVDPQPPKKPVDPKLSPDHLEKLKLLFKLRPTLNYIFSSLHQINNKLDNLPDRITFDLKNQRKKSTDW